MSQHHDRRRFLKQTAGVFAGAGLAQSTTPVLSRDDADARSSNQPGDSIPPHRSLKLTGLHAYAEKSIAAGDTLHLRTSSSVPYKLSICQLAGDVDDQKKDVVLHTFDESPATPQPIRPGSYVRVEKNLTSEKGFAAVTLECWVRPWTLKSWQGLLTQYEYEDDCGIGLFIDDTGRALFYLGDGGKFDETRMFGRGKLNHRRWNHIAGTWDGKKVVLWVNGRKTGEWDLAGAVKPGKAPLRLGAYGKKGVADHFLEGDLAMPAIYDRALSAEDVRKRIDARGLKTPPKEGLLACWPLDEEGGDQVQDSGPNELSGQIINHGAWMIGGPSFKGDDIGRYDEAYDPQKDEKRGHGLRFASDDLFDCRWKTTQTYSIPKDAKSGLYVGRYEYAVEGKPYEYNVTFNVRRPESRRKPSILVLVSSSSWRAYNSAGFPVGVRGLHFFPVGGLKSSHPQAPAYSCYRNHRHGQPAYYFGMNMPWPSAAPNALFHDPKMRYSHLMRSELFVHRWLDGVYGDHEGYEYDVVTDYDLHSNPDLLKGYKTIFINGHSEYWSAEAFTAVDRFLAAGGTAALLSGNTMFWRTSFSEDGSVMECRKFDPRIGGRGGATIGELYHSQDKKRGSLMRECGYPAWKCVGLECCGWAGVDGVYHADAPDHFLFNKPEKCEFKKNETFGHNPNGKYPLGVGHEWDIRLSSLLKMTRKVPEGVKLPEEPAGITTLARGIRPPGGTLDYFTANAPAIDGLCAEMIYWERPTGGRVFHAGSIGAGWALSVDPKWRTVMRNVLHHFDVKPKPA